MMKPLRPAGWGPEPFIPNPGRRRPSPPVVTVNGNGPDENGNVQILCVMSVNGYNPAPGGAVRIPKTFYGSGEPSFAAGCIEGDTYFDRTTKYLYHFTLVGASLRWVRQSAGYPDTVRKINTVFVPDEDGNVRIPSEFHSSEDPVDTVLPTLPDGYIEGDSIFVTSDCSRWVLCEVTGGFRWIREGTAESARTWAQQIAETDTSHMKDSEKTALLQKLAAYVKEKEGLS